MCSEKDEFWNIDGRVEYTKENNNWVMYKECLFVRLTWNCILFFHLDSISDLTLGYIESF